MSNVCGNPRGGLAKRLSAGDTRLVCYSTMVILAVLLAGGTARADITLDIGTGSGAPGQIVTVPLELITNPDQPSTVLVRIMFKTSELQYVSASLGANAVAAGKQLEIESSVNAEGGGV